MHWLANCAPKSGKKQYINLRPLTAGALEKEQKLFESHLL